MTVKLRSGKKVKTKQKFVDPPKIIDKEEQEVEEQIKYSDDSFRELVPEDLHAGYDNTVNDWLLRKGLFEQNYTLRVYRFDSRGERVHVGKFSDHIPDEDEIGHKFGGGKYECMLTVSDKNRKRHVTSSRFSLDDNYNDIIRERKQKLYQDNIKGNNGVPMNPGFNNFDSMIEGISKLMVVMMPLFNRNDNNSSPDMASFMLKNYEMMQGVMKRSILDQQQNVNDIQRMSFGVPDVMDDIKETTGLMGVINNLSPLIEKFLPLILGGGMGSKTAVGIVKAVPQYQQIVQNKTALKEMIAIIERNHGKDAVKKVLQEFKLKRPKKAKV